MEEGSEQPVKVGGRDRREFKRQEGNCTCLHNEDFDPVTCMLLQITI